MNKLLKRWKGSSTCRNDRGALSNVDSVSPCGKFRISIGPLGFKLIDETEWQKEIDKLRRGKKWKPACNFILKNGFRTKTEAKEFAASL